MSGILAPGDRVVQPAMTGGAQRGEDVTRLEHGSRVAHVPCLALLVFAALASPAVAQKADRPIVRAGDRWQFVEYYGIASTVPNHEWVVTSVTTSQIEGTENGEPLILTSELNVLESPRNRNSNQQALSFPLGIGKQWRFTSEWVFKVTGSKGNSVVDVEVVSYEKVNVPAGDSEALKLMSKGNIRGLSAKNSLIESEVTSTYWYAPAARAIVKSISACPPWSSSNFNLNRERQWPARCSALEMCTCS